MEFKMKKSIYIVVDTETGGFDSKKFSILSIGAVIFRPFEIIASKEFLIAEPQIHYEDEALEVNKIDIELIRKKGLSPEVAINAFEEFINAHINNNEKPILAGHNLWFDIGFIERLYNLAGRNFREKFSYRLLDTASILTYLCETEIISLNNPSLDNGIKYFNVTPPNQRHTAVDDAIATAQLLSEMLRVEMLKA